MIHGFQVFIWSRIPDTISRWRKKLALKNPKEPMVRHTFFTSNRFFPPLSAVEGRASSISIEAAIVTLQSVRVVQGGSSKAEVVGEVLLIAGLHFPCHLRPPSDTLISFNKFS